MGAYHGFDFSFTAAGLSGSQSVYVYAIDSADSDKHTLLDSKTVTVTEDTDAPTIANVQVTDISTTGCNVSCTVADNVGVTMVSFPTQTTANNQDNILWHDGAISGNTASVSISIADHNNEDGT